MAEQDQFEQVHPHIVQRLGRVARSPTHDQIGFVLEGFFRAHRIGVGHRARFGPAGLAVDSGGAARVLESGQSGFEKRDVVRSRYVAVEEEIGIAGVVVAFVKVEQLPVSQLRDGIGFST